MTSIRSLSSLVLGLPPSCIAFCPTYPQYLVVGTYFLHPKTNKQAEPQESVSSPRIRQDAESEASDDVEEVVAEVQQRSGSLVLYHVEGQVM